MKKLRKVGLLASLFTILSLAVAAQQKASNTATRLALDLKNSKIFWRGPKSVGHKHEGHLLISSGFITEIGSGSYGDGNFIIDMKSLKTTDDAKPEENKRVDEMLKKEQYFFVTKFPTALVHIKKIVPTTAAYRYKVIGDLTLRGVTHPVEFIASIKKIAQKTIATASLTIDRKTWGINAAKTGDIFAIMKDKMIADEIPVSMNLVFVNR